MKSAILLFLRIFILLSLFTADLTLLAQNCEVEAYNKTIISPGNVVRSRQIVNNNQSLFVSFKNEVYNFGITKTDLSSNPFWMNVYQPDGQFSFYDIVATQDGGVIRLGRDTDELGIIKLNAQGNIQWSKKYPSPNWTGRAHIIQTENGEFMVASAWDQLDNNPRSCLLMSLDSDGNILWTNYVERTSSNDFNRFIPEQITPAPDGGYLITGKDLYTMMLMKVDENGNTIWLKRSDIGTTNLSTNTDYLTVVNEGQTGYYIFLYAYGTANDRAHLLEIDLFGNIIKSKEIISDDFKGAGQLATLPSGNIVVSGLPLGNTDNTEAMVLLDTAFNVIVSKAIGLPNPFSSTRYNKNFVTIEENIYLIDNYQSGTDEGFYVQKASADLEVACQEENILVTLEDLPVTQENSSFSNYAVDIEVQNLSVDMTSFETEEVTICEATFSAGAVYGSDQQIFCEGDPATVNGITYSTDTILVNTYPTSGSCDSIHTTILNFQAPQFTFEDLQVCDENTVVVFGQNIFTDTTLYGDFQTTIGCDSIHQINIIFGTNKFTDEYQQYCQGTTVNVFGNPTNISGTYTETYTAFDGCDSTHAILAEFKNNLLTVDLLDYCDGETATVDGWNYTSDTILFENTVSYFGCDSTHRTTLRFFDNIEITQNISACAGETIEVYGLSINQDTSFFRSVPAPITCDSIWSVTISFLEIIETTESITACDGDFISVFGNPVFQNTSESRTFTATNGCDSVHTIDVIFNPIINTQEILEACDGETLTVFGNPVTENGTFTENFSSGLNCDSTHQIEAIFNPLVSTFETQNYCAGSIAFVYGNSVTTDTLLSETYTGFNNCDSTHQIEIVFTEIINTSETITSCFGEVVTIFDNPVTSGGTFTENYTATNGCDSTHTVILVFDPTISTQEILEPCEGDILTVFGNAILEDGILVETYTSSLGCDSTHQVEVYFRPVTYTESVLNYCAGETVEINNVTISTDQDITFVETGFNGCDSTHLLSVRFIEETLIEDTIHLCADEYVLFFEDTIRNSGIYSNFIPTSDGSCDTIYQLAVTQSDLTMSSVPDTIYATFGVPVNLPLQIENNELTVTWNESEQLSCTICMDPVINPQYDESLEFVISDNSGCKKTDQLFLRVDQTVAYYIPNAFSPNNDQINDRFIISTNEKIQSIKRLEIFDRWGAIVYQEFNTSPNDPDRGWDGNFKGRAAQQDVYVYQIEILLANGTTVLKAGDLLLFR